MKRSRPSETVRETIETIGTATNTFRKENRSLKQRVDALKESRRSVRGPRRLEFLPDRFRLIPGVEHLTTESQLTRLKQYVETSVNQRPAFIRLGCSVQHSTRTRAAKNSSVWAVSVCGKVEIISKSCDPRSAYKWFKNAARAWNLERMHPTPGVGIEQPPARHAGNQEGATSLRHYIMLLDPSTSTSEAPIVPVAETVRCVNTRKVRGGNGETDLIELLIEGVPGWWLSSKLEGYFFTVREVADGEVFSGDDGSCWVTRNACIHVPTGSWADMVLLAHNREEHQDLYRLLRNEAETKTFQLISMIYDVPVGSEKTRALSIRIQLALRRIDLLRADSSTFKELASALMEPARATRKFPFAAAGA